MNKPELIRQILQTTIPDLKTNPDKLEIYVDQGSVVATGAHSTSFEYRYTLNIIITDFAQHPDIVMVPLVEFIKRHQPELVENPNRREDGFTFVADILSNEAIDLSIYLKLTERVIVKIEDDKNIIQHVDEPPLPV